MSDTIVLTTAAAQRLRAELEHLEMVKRPELTAAIEESRSAGDIAENTDFFLALTEAARIDDRISAISHQLATADIVDSVENTGQVAEGVTVDVRYDGDDDTVTYFVGTINERPADGSDVLTPTSPLGQALLGARVGDTVNYAAPAGTLAVTITAIR